MADYPQCSRCQPIEALPTLKPCDAGCGKLLCAQCVGRWVWDVPDDLRRLPPDADGRMDMVHAAEQMARMHTVPFKTLSGSSTWCCCMDPNCVILVAHDAKARMQDMHDEIARQYREEHPDQFCDLVKSAARTQD